MPDELIRLSRGLYRPPSTITRIADRYAALLTVLPRWSAVAGLAAGHVHAVWLPQAEPPAVPDVIITAGGVQPRQRARSMRAEVRTRRRVLRRDEICIVDGVVVTSAPRTWVDLAAELSLFDLVAVGDCLLRRGLPLADLQTAVARARGRRGVAKAREALPLLDGASRSRPESHLRCILVCGGLPTPRVNVAINNRLGEWLAEPDLHYPEARLALEYNGRGHADVGRTRKDITRELDVEGDGWRVVVFGPRQVFARPDAVLIYVQALLDERDPRWRDRMP